MTDRPKRPTRRQIVYRCRPAEDYNADEADAYMDYLTDLLRRAVWSNERLRAHIQRLLAGLSTSNIDEAMEEGRVICTEIREAIGEEG